MAFTVPQRDELEDTIAAQTSDEIYGDLVKGCRSISGMMVVGIGRA
jgi:hypothetical protein